MQWSKSLLKDAKKIALYITGALIVSAILVLVDDFVKNLKTESCIISIQAILKAVILMLLSPIPLIPSHLIPYIKNKRKNIKHYSPLQIEIAKKIFNKKIKTSNDYFLDKYDYKLLDEPFNKLDDRPNYFVKTELKSAIFLMSKFKDIIQDLIQYGYITLKEDTSINEFVYLKKSEYRNARRGMEIFHDLDMVLQNELKQKYFIVLNPKKLKKLIRKKRLPEKMALTTK